MNSDIVYRLRMWNRIMNGGRETNDILREAADTIEVLRKGTDCYKDTQEGIKILISILEQRVKKLEGVK